MNAIKDHVSALGALYQAEKTDAAGIFNTAMALMGIGCAYIGVLMTVSDKFGKDISWPIVLLLPIPLWIISAFQSLMTLNAMSHGVSVRIIEYALFSESGLPGELRKFVGSASGDKIMDISQSELAHKITTIVVYSGVVLLVGGFTLYVLCRTWYQVSYIASILAATGYTLLLIIVVNSWVAGKRILEKANKQYLKHFEPKQNQK
ncbi:MAG: hypothetical protein WC581_10655 [Thermodesulfovibrionales bacterium]